MDQELLKENILLRADVSAIIDVLADYMRGKSAVTRKEFNEFLFVPKQQEQLKKLVDSESRLTAESKEDILKLIK